MSVLKQCDIQPITEEQSGIALCCLTREWKDYILNVTQMPLTQTENLRYAIAD